MNIKELAEQAGYLPDMFGIGHWDTPECKRFAELVRQDERKRLNGVTVHEQMLIDGQQSLLRGKR